MVSEEDLQVFTNIILENLKEEFSLKKLSGNLLNTITVEKNDEEIRINIPARTYNMLLYQQKGVVVHTGHGSYASKLDEQGSNFYVYPNGGTNGRYKINPKNHKDFVNRVVQKSLEQFVNIKGYEIVKREETV